MVKWKGKQTKNPLGKAIHTIRELKAKTQCVKTESNFEVPLGTDKKIVGVGCTNYTNLQTGYSTITECDDIHIERIARPESAPTMIQARVSTDIPDEDL